MDAKLKVIRGGKAMKPGSRGRQFISGYVTDTRLMGVIGMELRWDVISDARVKTLNQIFYLDAEEFGLESYTEAFGDNPEAIRVERNRLIGALGGNVVPVTEAEARFILQSYVRINKKYRQSLPAGYEKYKFLLSPLQQLSAEEYRSLFARVSGKVESANFVLNYYLMRTFARDRRGIAFLTEGAEEITSSNAFPGAFSDTFRDAFPGALPGASPGAFPAAQSENGKTDRQSQEHVFPGTFPAAQSMPGVSAVSSPADYASPAGLAALPACEEEIFLTADYQPVCPPCDIYTNSSPATMCRNTIEPTGDPADNTFLCESVVEYGNRYHIIVSEIQLNAAHNRVVSAKKCSSLRITSTEAAMIMNCSEFITVYDVAGDNEMFLDAFYAYVETFTETSYDTGRLYIDFFDTNDHVGKPEYRMNDDIRAMYYLTDFNQLLVVAYSYEAVFEAELHLTLAMMPNYMRVSKKYEFREPIIYEFIKSNYEDFHEFLSELCGIPEG